MSFAQILSLSYNLSPSLQDKLNKARIRLKSELDLFTTEDLINRFAFTNQEIVELDAKVRKRSTVVGLSVASLQQRVEFIRFGCATLDNAFGGHGLPTGRVSQISGEAGAGKSQICMQLCIMVQLSSNQGGLNAEALYIDTEDSFRSDRIHQMALNRFKGNNRELRLVKFKADEILTKVHIRKLNTDATELCNVLLRGQLDSFFEYYSNVRLLIVDSIAYHFRYDYAYNNNTRVLQLMQIAAKLKQLAYERNIAVFVTNQVTYNNLPALGPTWHSACSTSVLLRRREFLNEQQQQQATTVRQGELLKSPDIDLPFVFQYCITSNGIEDLVKTK